MKILSSKTRTTLILERYASLRQTQVRNINGKAENRKSRQ